MQLSEDEEDYDYQLSLTKFESMLKTNRVIFFDSEEFEDIILHYLDSGKINLAKKALKLAMDQHPNSIGLKLVMVEMLIYEDKLDLAEKILVELEIFEPTNEEIYIQKATIFSKRKKHKEAIELLQTALLYTDDLADVYNLIGMEYLFLDNLEAAKDNFILCLENDEDEQGTLYNVVYCYEFLEQYEDVILFLDDYINQNPYSEIAWHQLGRIQYGQKNYVEAIRCFEYAILIDEAFLGAYMEKAKTHEKLKEFEKAIEAYNQTLELDDPTSYALLRIGKCHEKLGNNALALQYYNKTVHEDPLLDKGWVAITDFYVRQKKFEKALYFVNKALSIDNQNRLYWKRYATISKQLNHFEEAEFGFRKAVEHGDNQLDTWLFWIDMLQFLGEFNTAIKTLLLASEFFPEEFQIEYRLAGLYFMLDEIEKASFHLNNGLRLNFKSHLLLEKLFPVIWERKVVKNAIDNFGK